ncbi:LysR family transcriptional regulator [Saccharopolyspora shandongensis]|uniref:LysR family transcriptional regulator n=1 Tax=Saccharopolyspora shandongensis TaxID=418495 RepID=UPI0033E8513F
MDLDLAQVRAFVAAARESHFGRAAAQLFISQQALSKRIARLERQLGVRLFDRDKHGVALTEAGCRFLEPAQQALAAADFAVTEARRERRSLRVDVWGHLYAPMRTIGLVVENALGAELGLSRDLVAATTALARGEIDAGFGRVPPLGEEFEHQVVRLEPVDAIVGPAHPLAGSAELRPADLRGSTIWCPAALDRLDFLDRLTVHFGLDAVAAGVNLGLDHFLDQIRAKPERVAILPSGVPLPENAPLSRVPLTRPTPLYAWSLLWRRGNPSRSLDALRRSCAEAAIQRGWLDYDATRHWLPDADRAALD